MFEKKIIPMMAKDAESPFSDPNWIFEPKFDGVRAIYYEEQGKRKLETRRGINTLHKFPEFEAVGETVVLDGEIVVFQGGIPDFQATIKRVLNEDPLRIEILSRQLPAVYMVFDVLYYKEWLLDSPIERRKQILDDLPLPENFVVVPFVEEAGIELFDELTKKGFEGIMAKALGTPYIPGKRVDFWLKIKKTKTVDAVICGLVQGEGRRAPYFGSLVLGMYRNGELIHVGNVGTGFDEGTLKELLDLLLPHQINTPPIKDYSGKRPVIWIEPKFVAEVAFQSWTKDGKLRMPRFIRLRPDKKPEDCVYAGP